MVETHNRIEVFNKHNPHNPIYLDVDYENNDGGRIRTDKNKNSTCPEANKLNIKNLNKPGCKYIHDICGSAEIIKEFETETGKITKITFTSIERNVAYNRCEQNRNACPINQK